MKFYAKDLTFFADISEDLKNQNSSVAIGHLSSLDELKHSGTSQWIVVEDSLTPVELISEIHKKDIPHFVQKNEGHFEPDLKRTAMIVEDPKSYFKQDHLLISSPPVSSTTIQFSKPEDKPQMLEAATKFLDQLQSAHTQEAAYAIIEELYMNAVLDAPKEAARKGFPASQKPSELFMSYDQDTLQISCTDSCGSLDLKKLFSRMFEVYQKGAGEAINMTGPGGAGIGCFLLFEHCRSLIFGVQPGTQTKVTCLIPLVMSLRARAKLKKSIHGFEVKS